MQLNMSNIKKPLNIPIPDPDQLANHNDVGDGGNSKKRKLSASIVQPEPKTSCCGSLSLNLCLTFQMFLCNKVDTMLQVLKYWYFPMVQFHAMTTS